MASLACEPNAEGIAFLVASVLPLMRRQPKKDIPLTTVGRSPGPAVLALGREPGVTVVDSPPDDGPFNAKADLAISPLRAGGGTRIKILEAFSYAIHVGPTTIGAEGGWMPRRGDTC